ncbi:hypothetical protein M0804_002867 [Polistes exclamans]|nr:hypothetical protein M0804_002867 [Polistes exclamans]
MLKFKTAVKLKWTVRHYVNALKQQQQQQQHFDDPLLANVFVTTNTNTNTNTTTTHLTPWFSHQEYGTTPRSKYVRSIIRIVLIILNVG